MTLRETLTAASNRIARRDAETLLAHLLDRNRAWLLAHLEAELTPSQTAAFHDLTTRRAANEPLQYLTGQQEFFGLPLHVTRDTLIPRPETELLVEAVLEWVTREYAAQHPTPLRILDIGTGTGAIALALASRLPGVEITATDISPAALEVAQQNALRLGLNQSIRFALSDLLSALPPDQTFDIIVSNPPYVPTTDAPTLAPEVRDFEPALALFAGPAGLDIYRRLIPAAHSALTPNGLLALEFGFGQRDALHSLLQASPTAWHTIRFLNDYANIPRIALAHRS